MSGNTDFIFRPYNHKQDAQAILEMFREVGWMEKERNRGTDDALLALLKASPSRVAELRSRPEALAATGPGELRYLGEDLKLCAVTAVVTSMVARRMNCASRVTAEAIADAAEAGAHIAGLGVFEQGFYERVGFGPGPYEHWFDLDPATLKVDNPARPAHRLTNKDWREVHRCLLARRRGHCSCNVLVPELIRFEMAFDPKGFGFGYREGGRLTHHVWFSNQGGEHGPLTVLWMAYRNYEQLKELLSLIKSIGDQFHLVQLREPPDTQLQDLIDRPFQRRRMTRRGRFEQRCRAEAYWQLRILDLEACIAKTHLPGNPSGQELRFNLELSDPIRELLPRERGWRGVDGSYRVSIGQNSSMEAGREESLPTLQARVGAFTRMWIGACRASALTLSDTLSAPPELIRRLDETFHLPAPHTDWDF